MASYDIPRRCRHVETIDVPQVLTTSAEINRWLYARQEENCSACVAEINRALKREHDQQQREDGCSPMS